MNIQSIGKQDAFAWNTTNSEQLSKAGIDKAIPTVTKEAVSPSASVLPQIDKSLNRGIHVDIYA